MADPEEITIEGDTPLECYVRLAQAMDESAGPTPKTLFPILEAVAVLMVFLTNDRAKLAAFHTFYNAYLGKMVDHHADIRFGRNN